MPINLYKLKGNNIKPSFTIRILGSGTSQGVPVIACDCPVCISQDIKDKRLRTSALISFDDGSNYVIDSGPDFRQQMLNHQIKNLDGILFTHEHKDHISGLDDVRAFNHKYNKAMQIYCSNQVEIALKREFHYVFSNEKYPGIPKLDIEIIDNQKFTLSNHYKIVPILVYHYKMPVFGFRIGDFTYITDAKTINDEEKCKIDGSKVLVINCLHEMEHISHFNLKEVLEFIESVQVETVYLTHISHYFGKHEEILKKLPPNIYPCYDGLILSF